MKVKVYTHPSSLRAVKIKVASLSAKLDEKPQLLPDLTEDGYDEIKDELLDYDAIKNGEQENPFYDDRSL